MKKFNVESKAQKAALSSTDIAEQNIKEETKTSKRQCPFHAVQVQILRSVKSVRKEIRVTMEERICETGEF